MTAIARTAALLFVALLAACYPTTREPVGSTGPMTVDARLIGGWQAINKEARKQPTYLFFLRRDDNKLEAVMVETAPASAEKGDWMNFEVLTGKAGGRDFINGRTLFDNGKAPADASKDYTPVYYRFDANGVLRLFVLDEKAIENAIAKGEIKGEVKKSSFGDDVRITAEAKAVDAYFAAHDPKTLFTQSLGVYRRLK